MSETDFTSLTTANERGEGISFIVNHRKQSITLYRDNVALAAQNVALFPLGQVSTTQQMQGSAGQPARDELLIVGAATLNIRRGDEFAYQTSGTRRNWRVMYVEKAIAGQIQARAEVMQ